MIAQPISVALSPASASKRERAARIATSIANGTRIASADMQIPHEWFVCLHHGVLTVLSQARGLTGGQFRYLLALYQHSIGLQSEHAIRTLHDRRVATIADWSHWLGLAPKHIYRTRRELHDLGVIQIADDDANRVHFNAHWEDWDARVFAGQCERRSGTRLDTMMTATVSESISNAHAETTMVFLSSEPAPVEISNYPLEGVETTSSRGLQITATSSPNQHCTLSDIPKEKDEKETTDAQASDTLSGSIAITLLPVLGEASRSISAGSVSTTESSTNIADKPTLSVPPADHSPAPPTTHRERRRPPPIALDPPYDGETRKAYWLRQYVGQRHNRGAERYIAHLCAHEMLGFTLTTRSTLHRDDAVLLAQLKQQAGNWGTVLHWIITCSASAVIDVRAYLRGMARHHTPSTDIIERETRHDYRKAASAKRISTIKQAPDGNSHAAYTSYTRLNF